MADKFALKVHEQDHVATAFNRVAIGDLVAVSDKSGRKEALVAKTEIPYGHKIAVCDIAKGEKVFKYGEVIGRSTCFIQRGTHVHVQNMESLRGRGDFLEEDKQEKADAI
ncbi:MAG: D-galactarate dehydratase [Clostridia bacterium]|nr:D-galactarate dehydratase [Clostridia bacterium]